MDKTQSNGQKMLELNKRSYALFYRAMTNENREILQQEKVDLTVGYLDIFANVIEDWERTNNKINEALDAYLSNQKKT